VIRGLRRYDQDRYVLQIYELARWVRLRPAAHIIGPFHRVLAHERSEAPPVMRMSRKVLSGLVGVGAILVGAMLIFALNQGSRRPGGDSELYNADNKSTPGGLSGLPRDYAGIVQDKAQPETVKFARAGAGRHR
jgi:hypothetical protein